LASLVVSAMRARRVATARRVDFAPDVLVAATARLVNHQGAAPGQASAPDFQNIPLRS